VVLNATSLFNRANVAMPAALDRVLRLVVVTPAPGSRRENPEHVFR
jgi:hypothetical protein